MPRLPTILLSFSLLLSAPLWAQEEGKVVVAHRGASGYLPEHTLEAKALAFAMGADYLEQDVVMTRDDQLVVFHDLTLQRMTNVADVFPGRARADGAWYVIDFTLDELRQLRLHEGTQTTPQGEKAVFPARFPPELGNFHIHTLREELEFIEGLERSTGRRVGIYPELKSPWFHHQQGKDLSRAVLTELKHYGYDSRDDRIYLQSFDYPELERVKRELFPELGVELKLVQLIAPNAWGETQEQTPTGEWHNYDYSWMHSAEGLKKLSALVDGVGPAWDMLVEYGEDSAIAPRSRWVRDAHAVGLTVHPYTFRREADQLPLGIADLNAMFELFLIKLDVDGVFTDFPDLAREFLQAH
jgi:glycerophosphoryl diester phosphodiesterase